MSTEILHFKRTGKYPQSVMGESNYQEHLARAMESDGGFPDIDLFLEDHNKFDQNAVAVVYETDTVGYLSRSDALKYRNAIKALEHPQAIGTCSAKIIGGGEGKSYGIVLDLDLNNLQIESISQVKSSMPSTPVIESSKPTIINAQPSAPKSSLKKFLDWFFAPSKYRRWRIVLFFFLVLTACGMCQGMLQAITGNP